MLLSGLTVVAAPGTLAASVNGDEARVFVLNNNIENRKCKFRWVRLLEAIDADKKNYPDILILQQVGGTTDLEAIKKKLKTRWGVSYEGELSLPDAGNATMKCADKEKEKEKGTAHLRVQANAVLWNPNRFSKVAKTTWHSDARVFEGGAWSGCQNLAPAIPRVFTKLKASDAKKQRRTTNVAVALADRRNAGKYVVAASVHWPREPKKGEVFWEKYQAHPCAKENMREANAALERLKDENSGLNDANTLMIVGGDMNARTSVDGWWNYARSTLGYTDPIADRCGQTQGSDPKKCAGTGEGRNVKERTTAKLRIDYLLVKNGTPTKNAETVDQPKSGKLYSNHRAVWAPIRY